jgi:hypothetical protein
MRLAAIAALTVMGMLALPALAGAAGEPRWYHGTVQIDQARVGPMPVSDSSMTYSFHALYTVRGRRTRPFSRAFPGGQYALRGSGNQTFAYQANLHTTGSNTTYDNVADWHGSGRWTKGHGNVGLLNVFGRRFSISAGPELPPGTIPLSVESRETQVFADDTQSCLAHFGQTGSTLFGDDTCAASIGTVTIPVRTRVNPFALLSEGDPRFAKCPGTNVSVRHFNGFCGSAKRGGRIRGTHVNVWPHAVDYPFYPWEDQAAALDAERVAGAFYGPGTWGDIALRTTFKIDLRPGR